MKLQKVISICNASKNITLFNDESKNEQWVTDGIGVYRLDGYPRMSVDQLLNLFGIPEDRKGKYSYKESAFPATYDFSDYQQEENAVEPHFISIVTGGRKYIPITLQNGTCYFAEEYFKPFANDKGGYQLYERVTADGKSYIIIKEGMFAVGLILPIASIINHEFVSDLNAIASGTIRLNNC